MDDFLDYYAQHCPPNASKPRFGQNINKNYTKKSNILYRCTKCKQVWQSIWNRQIEYLSHFKNLPAIPKTCIWCNHKEKKNGI